ncbi:replication/maintenance protein RepL [Paenibacillus bovis]|uniref:Plasmid replication protein RepL domain-containing protein n=1 Tax=Paenibacillus bovis TaxID=1616788 RepID=A0A1X9T4C5_9BACL|nr:replication/maintenance protein RepL [Paenibacillus bovis]ARR10788.1 hypothetical protein AR543_p0180 [Paenibacillus bovis]
MRKKRNYLGEPYWGAIVLDFLRILHSDNLSSAEYKIFFFLTDKMSRSDNRVDMKQSVISTYLNMDKATVSKAIKRLCELQWILKLSTGSFMVNPHLIYVGNRGIERVRDNFDRFLEQKGLPERFEMNDANRELMVYFNHQLVSEKKSSSKPLPF